MNSAPMPADHLSDQALDWMVLLHSGTASTADREAFRRWREFSPSHDAAACEAEALWGDLAGTRVAVQMRDDLAGPSRRAGHRFRQRRVVAALALAASVILAGLGVIAALLPFGADVKTATGEIRRIALPDGSVAVMNTASALSMDYSPGLRHIVLLKGEAVFEVAKDASRPFVVEAGEGRAQAVGTVYGVRRHDGAARVTVTEGTVAVSAFKGEPVRVHAGQQADYGSDNGVAVHAADVTAETAWMRGKLIFNRRPLGEVMAEFARYHHGQIVVADAELRKLEVTGVFDLDDEQGFFRSLQTSLNVRAVRMPLLTILY